MHTVLVVEDDRALRALMVRSLSAKGYRALEASDGIEALEQLAAEPDIELVVTDIVMPRMNGIDLARRFREMFPDTRILLMSGYADEPDLRQALPDPTIEFLPKPFTPQELAEKLREVLDG
jgi:CheY-like chemotaxis protein